MKRTLVTVLVLALTGGVASAEEGCAELLDAGVPGPALQVGPGYVVEQPAWLVPPARMCLVGQRLQECTTTPEPKAWPIVLATGLGVVGGAVVVLLTLWATGHLQ